MSSKPHFYYMQLLEIKRVEEQLTKHIDPEPPKLITVKNDYAVWEIELQNGQTHYMRNNFTTNIDHEFFVVHVDALRFYDFWLRSSIAKIDTHRSISCPVKKKMGSDYKFKSAANGFSHGRINPVPLAQVSANSETPFLGFINGVTRTLDFRHKSKNVQFI